MARERALGPPRRPSQLTVRIVAFAFAWALARFCYAASDSSADQLLSRAVSLAAAARLDDAEKILLEGKLAFHRDVRFPAELAGIAWRKQQSGRAKTYL